jgi:hypothetical protein
MTLRCCFERICNDFENGMDMVGGKVVRKNIDDFEA